jgi:hypothetical protein
MDNNEDFVSIFFDLLLNPKNDALERLIADNERAELDSNLSPEEQRVKGEKEALLLLSKQDKNTTATELKYYLNRYYNLVEVGRIVARHPSIDIKWLAHFMNFLPEDAVLNPNFVLYSQDKRWEYFVEEAKPSSVTPPRWSGDDLKRDFVSKENPYRYKVNYWLKNGRVADKRYIVSIEGLDESVIVPFVTDKSSHIRKEIAKRSSLSPLLAKKISQDNAKTVRLALAENEECPLDILVELTQSQDETVRRAALNNVSCPEDAIHAAKLVEAIKPPAPVMSLNKLKDSEIIKLLGDPATDSNTLEGLVEIDGAYIKAGVALHIHCPVGMLRRLSCDNDIMIRQSVGFNQNTPLDILQSFLDSTDNSCHIALASNPSLTEQQQLQLIEVSNDQCRKVLADTTEIESVWCALRDSAPTEKKKGKAATWRDSLKVLLDPKGTGLYGLQRGTKSRQLFVAKLVARHPKCPEGFKGVYAHYLFDSLAQNPNVALQLLENPNAIRTEEYADWKLDKWLVDGIAPGHVVNFYLHSDDIKRRRRAVDNWTACIRNVQPQVFYDDVLMKRKIAERKGNTLFMFEILARDKKDTVRELVAKNKECPAETLVVLAMDKVAAVKVAARQNKNYKASLVKAISGNNKIEELRNKGPKKNRIRMADEAISVEVLMDLAGDKIEEVRRNVASNEKTSLETLFTLSKDESEKVRERVASHKNASIELLESLFCDPDNNVRYNALHAVNWRKSKSQEVLSEDHDDYDYKNRVYDEVTLTKFYDDDYEYIQRIVARCTENFGVQEKIVKANIEGVCNSLASNRNLDFDIAVRLIESKTKSVLKSLIQNTEDENVYFKSLEADETLSDSLSSNKRMIKKRSVQVKLIAHKNEEVRKSCAYYVGDDVLLMLLARDTNNDVKERLCSSKSLTRQHVEVLLEKPTVGIISELIGSNLKHLNPCVTQLIEQGDETIREYIARNLKMRPNWEVKLREDDSAEVRVSLAKSWKSSLSNETQKILKMDVDASVREAITYNYS